MKSITIGARSAKNRSRQRGYTFGEVIIVLGVLAALIIGGFIVFNQLGSTAEVNQVVQHIGQRTATDARIRRGAAGAISAADYANSLNVVLNDLEATNSPAVTADPASCPGTEAGDRGIVISLAAGTPEAIATDFRANLHDAIVAAAGNDYARYFGGVAANADVTGAAADQIAIPTPTATATAVPLCLVDA